MENEIRAVLVSITIFNCIISTFILSTGLVSNMTFAVLTMFGLFIGMVNLYMRAIMLNHIAKSDAQAASGKHFLGYLIRVTFTAVIGALLFRLDKYYVIFYILGYVLHFSGVILHGFKLKILEGK